MQYISYYIGYLHYINKAGCRVERSKVFIYFLTEDLLLCPSLPHPMMADSKYLLTNFIESVTDRPYKSYIFDCINKFFCDYMSTLLSPDLILS